MENVVVNLELMRRVLRRLSSLEEQRRFWLNIDNVQDDQYDISSLEEDDAQLYFHTGFQAIRIVGGIVVDPATDADLEKLLRISGELRQKNLNSEAALLTPEMENFRHLAKELLVRLETDYGSTPTILRSI